MNIYSNQNGKIQYQQLNNDDLHALVKKVEYQKHSQPLLMRLKDDFALGRGAKKTIKRKSKGKRTRKRNPTKRRQRKTKQRKSRK